MTQPKLIAAQTICTHYSIEISFIDALTKMGLIQIHVIEEQQFVHHDEIGQLEKIIRLHNELNVNLEGIDVVFNLLEKEQVLRDEITLLKNRLRLYEND